MIYFEFFYPDFNKQEPRTYFLAMDCFKKKHALRLFNHNYFSEQLSPLNGSIQYDQRFR